MASCLTGTDALGNRWRGCRGKVDVTGGWYDAGDQGKCVVNGGISLWTLLNLYERERALGRAATFSDSSAHIPESGNGVSDILDEARWELEFFLKNAGSRQHPPAASARAEERGKRAGL